MHALGRFVKSKRWMELQQARTRWYRQNRSTRDAPFPQARHVPSALRRLPTRPPFTTCNPVCSVRPILHVNTKAISQYAYASLDNERQLLSSFKRSVVMHVTQSFNTLCLYKSSSEGTTVFCPENGLKRVYQILPRTVKSAGYSCSLTRWAAYHAQAVG